MLEAIIFDVDGTLADTEELHRAAFNAAFAQAGLEWHWDRALYGELLQVTGGKERIAHFAAGALDSEAIAALHRCKTRTYTVMVDRGDLALRPGVAALIEAAAREGIRLAIATTTSPAALDALLRATLGPDGPNRFASIAAGDMVAAKKPAPDVYARVLADLALPPTACVAIEDSAHGLHAALAAGIVTVVTTNSYTADQDFNGAALIGNTLSELGIDGGAILATLREAAVMSG